MKIRKYSSIVILTIFVCLVFSIQTFALNVNKIKIERYSTELFSNMSLKKTIKGITKYKKPTIKTAKNTGAGKVRIVVKKMKNVSGYRVFCSSTKKFMAKKTQKIISCQNKVVFKKLPSGKYFVKAQAYKTGKSGKRKYSKASKVISVKVSKGAIRQKCKLIVNGINLTKAGCYSIYNSKHNWAEIPLIPVLEAIGSKVEWQDDNLAKVTLNGEDYIFNVAKKSLTSVKSGYSVLFRVGGVYYPCYEVVDGEVIIDTKGLEWFLQLNGFCVKIDEEKLVVLIEKITDEEDMPNQKYQLIVNGIDLTTNGYNAIFYPFRHEFLLPFLPVMEALGAQIQQVDDSVSRVVFNGKKYIFNEKERWFGEEQSDIDYMIPVPGGFMFYQTIDDVFYLDDSTFYAIFDSFIGVDISVKDDVEKKVVNIEL